MPKLKKIISLLIVFCLIVLFTGCGCKKQIFRPPYVVTLEIWGLFDSTDVYTSIFKNYEKINPQIDSIKYRKLNQDTYKQDLINAFAKNQGPDIFLINNAWISQFGDLIAAAPVKASNVVNEQIIKKDFVDAVAYDFFINGKVYALPLSVDSLGLFYNKDMFNEVGIVLPPTNWDEFIADTQLLTKKGINNEILQSGAALGTAYNINRSSDILSLLMMQRGAQMNSNGTQVDFASSTKSSQYPNPGVSALSFYTNFASTSWKAYSWNPLLHYSIDAFCEGKLAMMLNYSWQLETIRSKSPKLNFTVAPIPQLADGVQSNYANYWAYVVAKNHKIDAKEKIKPEERVLESWKFLTYLTTNPNGDINRYSGGGMSSIDKNFDPAQVYLSATRKPAARKDLIIRQKSDADLGVFAEGNLLAKSWRQANSDAIGLIFAEAIESVNKGQYNPSEAIGIATGKINKSQ